jgi:hypothetical protein
MKNKAELENEVAEEVFKALQSPIQNNEDFKVATDKVVEAFMKLPNEPLDNEFLLECLGKAKNLYEDFYERTGKEISL